MNPGTRLGPYEVLEQLGAGGMGEVWLAQDSRLGRKVAVKVLPEQFASDPERLARFEQEARAAAALNHPGIAVVHDLGEFEGTRYIVQEYLQGQTLRERLANGRLPLARATEIAAEIADALAAAHRAGIVHRDLKPENIFVTGDGRAKVLDFGLAKLTEVSTATSGDASMSPTVLGTVAGQILGTVGYMAPEQVEGAEIDARADIFAFGCVLYEMVTGKRPFGGDSVHDTLHRIGHVEPTSIESVDPSFPMELGWILRKCLAKARSGRYQSAADLALDLRLLALDIASGVARPAASDAADDDAVPEVRSAPGPVAVGVLALISLASGWLLAGWMGSAPRAEETTAVRKLSVQVEDGWHLTGGTLREGRWYGFQRPLHPAVALSPDGSTMVYSATDGERVQLFVRRLDRASAEPLPDSEGGISPFFSPDGEWVGFYFVDDAAQVAGVRKAPVAGGETVTLLSIPEDSRPPYAYGASWSETGTIYLGAGPAGILALPDSGGIVPLERVVTVPEEAGNTNYSWPQALPGGRDLLFTVQNGYRSENSEIVVQPLETEEEYTVLLTGASVAHYLPTGHLAFLQGDALVAAPYDLESRRLDDAAIRLLERPMFAYNASNMGMNTLALQFSISATGDMAWVQGGAHPEHERQLVMVDPDGGGEQIPIEPADFMYVQQMPTSRELVVAAGGDGPDMDLWLVDPVRSSSRRLTFGGAINSMPRITPDGSSVIFASDLDSPVSNLHRVSIDNPGEPERLSPSDRAQWPASISADNVLAFVERADIWLLDLDEDDEPMRWLETPFAEGFPVISPDGRWMAYSSDQTGRTEVYVRAVEGPGREYPISTGRADQPMWSRDGRTLFYRSGPEMWAVSVGGESDLRAGTPRLLFEGDYTSTVYVNNYDLAPDGRFLLIPRPDSKPQPVTSIEVVLNWFDEVRERTADTR